LELKIDPATTVLVMVDMQNDFCHPKGFYGLAKDKLSGLGLEPRLVTDSIAPMRSLLEAARKTGLFVVHTQIIRDRSPDAVHIVHQIVPDTFRAVSDIPGDPSLLPGTWGAETHKDLSPEQGEYVVQKRSFSAFYGTDLDIVLRRRGIRTLLIAGTITYACVLHTAFDANVRDFDVVVSSDGTASWAADLQEPTLKMVDLILGQTASIGELIEALAIASAEQKEATR
jgi:nicotinamidase-related amidase